jgi:uncharacterized protein YndB with AHSA1/START domain
MSIPGTGRIVRTGTNVNVVIERTFRAPIGDVWASIVDPERMNRWVGTWTGEAGVGKTVAFTMTAEGEATPTNTLILECDPPSHFLVESAYGDASWRYGVDLSETDGITTIVFTHYMNEGDDFGSFGIGWEYYLDRLIATLKGESFASWDDYYPSQVEYWEAAASRA